MTRFFSKIYCVAYDGTMEAVFSRPRLLVNEHFRGVCGCDEKACIFSSFFLRTIYVYSRGGSEEEGGCCSIKGSSRNVDDKSAVLRKNCGTLECLELLSQHNSSR